MDGRHLRAQGKDEVEDRTGREALSLRILPLELLQLSHAQGSLQLSPLEKNRGGAAGCHPFHSAGSFAG